MTNPWNEGNNYITDNIIMSIKVNDPSKLNYMALE